MKKESVSWQHHDGEKSVCQIYNKVMAINMKAIFKVKFMRREP